MDFNLTAKNHGMVFETVSENMNPETSDILTMAFVNIQPYGETYDPEKAFCRGTLYPDLDKPLLVGGDK